MRFETAGAIVDGGLARLPINWPDIPPRVECPRCNNEFRSQRYLFFGFMPPDLFRILFYGFVGSFVLLSLIFALWPEHR